LLGARSTQWRRAIRNGQPRHREARGIAVVATNRRQSSATFTKKFGEFVREDNARYGSLIHKASIKLE
jgi:hypothetical protein